MVGHNPLTNQLDFSGNLDLDSGSLKEFCHFGIGNGKGSSSWVWHQSENTQATGPQIERNKGCLGVVLCSPSASVCSS